MHTNMNLFATIQKFFSEYMSKLVFSREGFSGARLSNISKKHVSTSLGRAYTETPYSFVLPYSHSYVRNALWSYKFRNNKGLAQVFAKLLTEKFQKTVSDVKNPLCVYVPSSPESNKYRGYCSNALIVNELSRVVDIEIADHVLQKKSGITKQSRIKTRTERLKNPRGAFVLKKQTAVRGRNIVLFDDVITTGATIKEVTRVLERAGARSVTAIALCH